MSFFDAVFPRACVHSAIAPLTSAVSRHSAHIPFSIVLPSLLLADENTFASLVSINVRTIIEVSIPKLPDAVAIWNVALEVAVVEFALRQRVLAQTLHLAMDPAALVRFLKRR